MSMRTMGLTEKGVGLGRMSVGQGARKHMQQIEVTVHRGLR